MKISRVVLLFALLLTFGAFSATSFGWLARAENNDAVDEEANVETEDEVYEEGQAEPGTRQQQETEEDLTPSEAEVVIGPASDVETSYVFTKYSDEELPAGKVVHLLISFRNTGAQKSSYLVNSIDASLRYPMDYSYHLQNYTSLALNNRSVDANREATFIYPFRTSEHYSGRPFGFVIEVHYFNEAEEVFMSTVVNKTINFVEHDDAFDAEAVMMYLLFGALAGLIIVVVYYYLLGGSKKSGAGKGRKANRIETGTKETNGAVHNEWLPTHARKSPKVNTTPKTKKPKKDN